VSGKQRGPAEVLLGQEAKGLVWTGQRVKCTYTLSLLNDVMFTLKLTILEWEQQHVRVQ
jgi:hypothetical protein